MFTGRRPGAVLLAVIAMLASNRAWAQVDPLRDALGAGQDAPVTPIVWQSFESARAQATKERRPFFLLIVAPWCSPCRTARVSMDTMPVLNKELGHWIAAAADPNERPDLGVLAVRGLPTLAILLPDGAPLVEEIPSTRERIQVGFNANMDPRDLALALNRAASRLRTMMPVAQAASRESLAALAGIPAPYRWEDNARAARTRLAESRDWIFGLYGTGPKSGDGLALRFALSQAVRKGASADDLRFALLSRARMARLMGPTLTGMPQSESFSRDWRHPSLDHSPDSSSASLANLAESLASFPDDEIRAGILQTARELHPTFVREGNPWPIHRRWEEGGGFRDSDLRISPDGWSLAENLLRIGAALGEREIFDQGMSMGDQFSEAGTAGAQPHIVGNSRGLRYAGDQLAAFSYWVTRAQLTADAKDMERAYREGETLFSTFGESPRPFAPGAPDHPLGRIWPMPDRLLLRMAITCASASALEDAGLWRERARHLLEMVRTPASEMSAEDCSLLLLAAGLCTGHDGCAVLSKAGSGFGAKARAAGVPAGWPVILSPDDGFRVNGMDTAAGGNAQESWRKARAGLPWPEPSGPSFHFLP